MTLRKVFNCEFFEKLQVKFIREWHYRSGRWLGNALSFRCLPLTMMLMMIFAHYFILYNVHVFYLRIMSFMYMHT